METVKVDIQKLQMLNDRINQTIDALSQLRSSVHGYQTPMGLQHSVPTFLPQQTANMGYNVPMQYGQQLGLQHTAAPFIMPQQPALGYNVQGLPYAVSPWTTGAQMGWFDPVGGLSHSTLQKIDPAVQRVTQTFPFAFSPIPLSI